jgi:hypothetical protein
MVTPAQRKLSDLKRQSVARGRGEREAVKAFFLRNAAVVRPLTLDDFEFVEVLHRKADHPDAFELYRVI